ncbi:hypothetical protein HanXRQr2_Chr09g0381141 [Helianthus annuus]|uniref:COP9 signalosome complex subunit 7 n=1 Tax=Helianthus annuus TaxID=4232 RepID=A0A9K3N7Y6_HELAN|nr:hypothetical protein HanXRQr2_Chr09g0381141 [Helianthus annuus]KAJ0525500.1 hypothetical protein HanHA300_Chr09g0312771 [Helianthus annuus]KAJ0892558.1 hypothetical protein HanPSC8_Chr09g0367301 [Helianthus annuus]
MFLFCGDKGILFLFRRNLIWDLRAGQLGNMIHTLSDWLGPSDDLLTTIQEKIKWADSMCELDKKHKKENVEMLEEAKNALSLKADIDFRGHGRFAKPGGIMDFGEDRRSKR